jgi:hypothetical protein
VYSAETIDFEAYRQLYLQQQQKQKKDQPPKGGGPQKEEREPSEQHFDFVASSNNKPVADLLNNRIWNSDDWSIG